MEGNRSFESKREPEKTEAEKWEIEHASEVFEEFIEKLELQRERHQDETNEALERKTNEIRWRLRNEGLRLETLRAVMNTLEQTGLEAFSAAELGEIISAIPYLLIEWDPAFHTFLKSIQQKLPGIIAIKKLAETKQE